jgi:pyruvate formate lyase activating enzyme
VYGDDFSIVKCKKILVYERSNIVKIAGIQKSTLVDFPGKIACVIFTQGCNFRCSFCHNPECVLPEKMMLFQSDLIPEESVFTFLESRKGFLDGVSICGGEPTIQTDLYAFAKKVKEM